MPFDNFALLYDHHRVRVRGIVSSILRTARDVDDVVQDVFVQVWQQSDRFDPARGNIDAWIAVIARSRAIDRLRADARFDYRAEWDSEISDPTKHGWGLAGRGDDAAIRSGMAALTRDQRELLQLAFEAGLSHARIAAFVGRPLGTVKTQIRSALATLRKKSSREAGFRSQPEPLTQPAFTVSLIRKDERPADFELTPNARNGLRGVRVVAIDDDGETLSMIGATLKVFGAQTTLCSSATAGLDAVDAAWPHFVIADLDMPGDDGYACLRQLRVLARNRARLLPVVAFTGRADEQERSRVRLAGFDAYLTKPVHPMALFAAASRVVSSPAA